MRRCRARWPPPRGDAGTARPAAAGTPSHWSGGGGGKDLQISKVLITKRKYDNVGFFICNFDSYNLETPLSLLVFLFFLPI